MSSVSDQRDVELAEQLVDEWLATPRFSRLSENGREQLLELIRQAVEVGIEMGRREAFAERWNAIEETCCTLCFELLRGPAIA